jgi:methyl-accepting chemotaxis protein
MYHDLEQTVTRGILELAGIGIVSLIAAVVIGLFFSGSVTRRIRRVMVATDRIAQGDLRVTLPETSKDEVGDLARNVDSVVDSLHEIIGTVVDRVRTLSETGNTLTANTAHTSATIQTIGGSVGTYERTE